MSSFKLWSGMMPAAIFLVLAACGGGGGGGGSSSSGTNTNPSWVQGVFQPSAKFANQCQVPRTGTDPGTGKPYPDVQGTTLDENNYLRSWTNELYLWYGEVQDNNPANYSTTATYFDTLKTMAKTSTGADKDKFHFTYATSAWEQLSQGGNEVGYGVTWDLVTTTPPRQAYAVYVWTDAQAASAAANNVVRGAQILQIDGVDMVNANDQASVDKLNAGLYPSNPGEQHSFLLQNTGSATQYTVTLTASNVTENPVPIVTTTTVNGNGAKVGYMLFTTHIATAEQALITAINQLKSANVSELVLDMRYNGGGLLDVASELAYMIAGPTVTAGQTFDLQQFNSKNPTTNPVTGQPIAPTPFHNVSQGISSSVPSGTALPYLGLQRVYVLTGSGTCSASEAVINGLDGVGVQVIQVGSTTCGKPYGFYPQDNCGTTYFSIEFRGVNAKDFGDYTDGFSPANSATLTSAVLPGCSVADDFGHNLGDPVEGRFATALAQQVSNTACPAATGITLPAVRRMGRSALRPPPWRENRILRPFPASAPPS